MERLRYLDREFMIESWTGVVRTDSYKQLLLLKLPTLIERVVGPRDEMLALDIGTGNGVLPVVLAGAHPQVASVVAYDINPRAVALAKENARLNGVECKVDLRCGTLFQPIREGEQFDVITAVLPAIPLTTTELRELPAPVRGHHWPDSTGGTTGRELIDPVIRDAWRYLTPGGVFVTAHADFLDCAESFRLMEMSGLRPSVIGIARKKLRETVLTALRREAIEKLDYRFRRDEDGDLYFSILVLSGERREL